MQTDDPTLRVLSLAQQHALSFLTNLDRAPAGATADVETLRKQLNKPLTDAGLSPEQVINQGLVRFLDPSRVATEQDHDHRTDEVIAAIVAAGEAFFGGTTWRGKRAMRVSVCNWRTSPEDVQRSISSVARVLGG